MSQASINVYLLKMERRTQAIAVLSNHGHRSHTASFLIHVPKLEPGTLSKGPTSRAWTQRRLSSTAAESREHIYKAHREPLLGADSFLMKRRDVHSFSKYLLLTYYMPGFFFALRVQQ